MCFLDVLFVFFGFWKGEKHGEKPGREQDSEKKCPPPSLRVPGAIYSPGMNFEVTALQPPKAFNWVNLDTPGKLLTSCF